MRRTNPHRQTRFVWTRCFHRSESEPPNAEELWLGVANGESPKAGGPRSNVSLKREARTTEKLILVTILHRLKPADRAEAVFRLLEHQGHERVVTDDETYMELPVGGENQVELVVSASGKVTVRTKPPQANTGFSAIIEYPAFAGDGQQSVGFFRKLGFEGDAAGLFCPPPAVIDGLVHAPALRCNNIRLKNFCGFESINLETKDNDVCAIIGNNGSGKTSILDALAISLSWLTKRVENRKSSGRRPSKSQIKNGAQHCELEISVSFYGNERTWTIVEKAKASQVEVTSEFGDLNPIVRDLQWEYNEDRLPINLPVVVYYPVNRAVLDVPRRIRTKHDFGPLEAYHEALSAGGRDFRLFFEWFRERENLENELFRDHPDGSPDPQLQAVRDAVNVFTGLGNLRVRRKPKQRMVVQKGDEELDVEQLSDGEKCLLALVGDLARRLALANPDHAEPLTGNGIVLIDEIELHLHPSWQRQVLKKLKKTFPNCQFFITTHSPLVLSQLPRDSVRILEQFKVLESGAFVEGREANSILVELMNVPVFPKETAAVIDKINHYTQAEEFDKARSLVDGLAEKLGENDPEIVHQRSAIDFLEAGVFEDD